MAVDWQTIITAAAVGSIASTVLTLVGQAFERRSRQRELLLSRSLDLAGSKRDFLIRLADKTGATVTLKDDIFLAEEYYEALSHLLRTGTLSPSAKDKLAKGRAKLEEEEKAAEQRSPFNGDKSPVLRACGEAMACAAGDQGWRALCTLGRRSHRDASEGRAGVMSSSCTNGRRTSLPVA
jgi:hypothetical protein